MKNKFKLIGSQKMNIKNLNERLAGINNQSKLVKASVKLKDSKDFGNHVSKNLKQNASIII